MKLENMPTPESDAARFVSEYITQEDAVSYELSQSLEQRLAVAVAALKELSCLGNGDQPGNSTGNRIAQETLAQIEEIKGYTCVEVTITEASEDQRGPEAEFTTSPSQEGVAEKSGQRSGSHQTEASEQPAEAVDSQERFIRNVARAALAQIEEGK